ncbi:transporter substrate-binding protein [Streptomyces sp. NPDC021080]|uniref:transporter substrate-binding protein n=1 Tax=Streptomyces sp. NPDC021080 TaxID=3365110 RepID=UPI0037B3791F
MGRGGSAARRSWLLRSCSRVHRRRPKTVQDPSCGADTPWVSLQRGVTDLAPLRGGRHYCETTTGAANTKFVAACRAAYGKDKPTSDPMEAACNSVHLWKEKVEKTRSFDVAKAKAASGGIQLDAPEGKVTVDGATQHVCKTARIGKCRGSRLVPTVVNGSPAFGRYRSHPAGTGHLPWALQVVEFSNERITSVTAFRDTDRPFPLFGLPDRLDERPSRA